MTADTPELPWIVWLSWKEEDCVVVLEGRAGRDLTRRFLANHSAESPSHDPTSSTSISRPASPRDQGRISAAHSGALFAAPSVVKRHWGHFTWREQQLFQQPRGAFRPQPTSMSSRRPEIERGRIDAPRTNGRMSTHDRWRG